ncbi:MULTISPECIES: Uma2 family endonuclease [unclassified Streptomyces]|uniref:Uma2 family endonuclease n=1 Tax=unclassified Streptomyces TaxID=2593676 RepID=UPI002366CB7C|nr:MULTISPECIES: Uma2 family endonuclease [unclassified Streptomyces]MDF3146122.1 Uma2 family endonuclease [Streptomyces sp. T21Q-yed]WDF39752.1 Uma2 family endonuclease [Streptomyces sp. T12]
MAVAEPIIMPGYQGEAIQGPYDDPDGDSDADSGVPSYEGASVEQVFELFSAAAPRGWRVELIEGEICVTPPANGEHEEILAEVNHQVVRKTSDDSPLRTYGRIGLYLPGSSVTGRAEPDLVIAPRGTFDDQEVWHDPSGVLLVAEVTSKSTADRDRHEKIHGYARAGIPVYLLIDREGAEVALYSDPSSDDYAKSAKYKLGLTVPLPDPLGFELDTAEF